MKTYFAILALVALTNGLSIRGPGGKNYGLQGREAPWTGQQQQYLQPNGVVGQQDQGIYKILQQQLVQLLESEGVPPQQSFLIAEEVIGQQGQVIIKQQIQQQLVQQLVSQGVPLQQAVLAIEEVSGLPQNIVQQQVIQQLVQQDNLNPQQAVAIVEQLFNGVYPQQIQQFIQQQLQQTIQQLQVTGVVGRQVPPQYQPLIRCVELLENQGIAPQQALLIAELFFGQQWQTIEQLVQLLTQQGIPAKEAFLISEYVLGGKLGQVIAKIFFQNIPLPEKLALKQALIQQGPALGPLVGYELNQLRTQGVIGQQVPVVGQRVPQLQVVRQQYPVVGQVFGQQSPVYGQQNQVLGQQYPVYGQLLTARQQYPNIEQQYLIAGQQLPVYGQQYPVYGQQYPVYGQQGPVVGGLRSAIWQQIVAQRLATRGRQY